MDAVPAPFGLTVCGLEELAGHCDTHATHVLSILDPDHPVPEAFGTYGEHRKLELRFHDIIDDTPGQVLPQRADVDQILAFGRGLQAEAGAHLLVHCHAGISRSTAAMVLILAQAMPDQPAAAVLALVHSIREKAWPNLLMMEMGDAALGRGGSLAAATTALHKVQIARRPHIVALMQSAGRGRELAAATS